MKLPMNPGRHDAEWRACNYYADFKRLWDFDKHLTDPKHRIPGSNLGAFYFWYWDESMKMALLTCPMVFKECHDSQFKNFLTQSCKCQPIDCQFIVPNNSEPLRMGVSNSKGAEDIYEVICAFPSPVPESNTAPALPYQLKMLGACSAERFKRFADKTDLTIVEKEYPGCNKFVIRIDYASTYSAIAGPFLNPMSIWNENLEANLDRDTPARNLTLCAFRADPSNNMYCVELEWLLPSSDGKTDADNGCHLLTRGRVRAR